MKFIKQNWFTLPLTTLMLFVTIGFIFTPHLPFSDNPFVEKSCEYAVHGMVILLALSLLFFAFGRYKLMLVGMSCVGSLCIFLKSASNDHLILPENSMAPKMSIAHFNLSLIGENYHNFIERLNDIDADILSLQELTPDWDFHLKKNLSTKYADLLKNVRIDPFGKALFSKKKLVRKDTIDAQGNPILKTMLKLGDKSINLLSAYILPPLNESSRNNAIDQLDILSTKVKSSRKPTIIIGDLNMVYWSNEIRAFRKDARLENSRRGFTPLGFKIPYDHMFYSEQLECSRFVEIQDSLSNHLGILGTFQFKNDPSDEEIRASVGNLGSK